MSRTLVAGSAAAVILACSPAPSAAQSGSRGPFADLYDDATIHYWQERYEPNLRYNFDAVVLPTLTPDERSKVGRLRFTVLGRHERDPLTYLAETGERPVITISVASIKFLDDIAIASAWLNENGYSQESIGYYASVLKYRALDRMPNGVHPAPLATLGVPSNALSDPRVNHASQVTLRSAIVFLLAHELGHVIHEHRSDLSAIELQRQEVEADRFAIETYRRIGLVPMGAVPLFYLSTYLGTHRADVASESQWLAHLQTAATHPLSSSRLRAISTELRRHPSDFLRAEPKRDALLPKVVLLATELDRLAMLLDDPLLVRHARIVGTQIPLDELRPRRPGTSWVPPHRP